MQVIPPAHRSSRGSSGEGGGHGAGHTPHSPFQPGFIGGRWGSYPPLTVPAGVHRGQVGVDMVGPVQQFAAVGARKGEVVGAADGEAGYVDGAGDGVNVLHVGRQLGQVEADLLQGEAHVVEVRFRTPNYRQMLSRHIYGQNIIKTHSCV